jgi:aryl-alcohol dehydrogenase-like predicted oxidoreductase
MIDASDGTNAVGAHRSRTRIGWTPVELQAVGRSDLVVSRVGLGCNNFGGRLDLERTRRVVEAALDSGITFFDTADIYGEGGSERFLGEILETRRPRVVLATKFGHDMGHGEDVPRGSRNYVRQAIDDSLERLRTDYVDLYYYHRPDGVTPLEETLAAMHELVDEGKARSIGCSNLSADELRQAIAFADTTGRPQIAALQNRHSLLERDAEDEVLPLCREHTIGFVPYFPLASGLLTGKYRRGEPPPAGSRLENRPEALAEDRLLQVEELECFAQERGRSLLELAVGGLASQPGIASVIAGATTPEQVRANVAAGELHLPDEDLAALAELRPRSEVLQRTVPKPKR